MAEDRGSADDGFERSEDSFCESAARFADGATMLLAASVRMQIIMLDYARDSLDELAAALNEAAEERESGHRRDVRDGRPADGQISGSTGGARHGG